MACCCVEVAADANVVDTLRINLNADENVQAQDMLDIRQLEEASTLMLEAEAEAEQKVEKEPAELDAPIEEAPPPDMKTDLESGLQDSLDSVPEISDPVQEEECLEPVASLHTETGTFDKNSPLNDDLTVKEDVLVQPAVEAPPADEALKGSQHEGMFVIYQAAILIVIAMAIHITALALPWWESKNVATGYKVEMGLWGIKTSTPGLGTTSLTWNEHCLGETKPSECTDGTRSTVTALSLVGLFFASGATLAFILHRDMGARRNWTKVVGLACLSLSIVLTVVSGQSSTWYPSNTGLKIPSYGFQLVWVSVALMLIAVVAALVGGR